MIAPTAMAEEGTGRDRRSKARAEKDMHRRAARSSFIKELADEVEGRPREVRCPYEDIVYMNVYYNCRLVLTV